MQHNNDNDNNATSDVIIDTQHDDTDDNNDDVSNTIEGSTEILTPPAAKLRTLRSGRKMKRRRSHDHNDDVTNNHNHDVTQKKAKLVEQTPSRRVSATTAAATGNKTNLAHTKVCPTTDPITEPSTEPPPTKLVKPVVDSTKLAIPRPPPQDKPVMTSASVTVSPVKDDDVSPARVKTARINRAGLVWCIVLIYSCALALTLARPASDVTPYITVIETLNSISMMTSSLQLEELGGGGGGGGNLARVVQELEQMRAKFVIEEPSMTNLALTDIQYNSNKMTSSRLDQYLSNYMQELEKELTSQADKAKLIIQEQVQELGVGGVGEAVSLKWKTKPSQEAKLIKHRITQTHALQELTSLLLLQEQPTRVDYASLHNGAKVVRSRARFVTSANFVDTLPLANRLLAKLALRSYGLPAEAALARVEGCWASEVSAKLVVQLNSSIRPSSIKLAHYGRAGYGLDMTSAAKDVKVYSVSGTKPVLLGSFVFQEQEQEFTLARVDHRGREVGEVDRVMLVVESNRGNEDYTCLYRFSIYDESLQEYQLRLQEYYSSLDRLVVDQYHVQEAEEEEASNNSNKKKKKKKKKKKAAAAAA